MEVIEKGDGGESQKWAGTFRCCNCNALLKVLSDEVMYDDQKFGKRGLGIGFFICCECNYPNRIRVNEFTVIDY